MAKTFSAREHIHACMQSTLAGGVLPNGAIHGIVHDCIHAYMHRSSRGWQQLQWQLMLAEDYDRELELSNFALLHSHTAL